MALDLPEYLLVIHVMPSPGVDVGGEVTAARPSAQDADEKAPDTLLVGAQQVSTGRRDSRLQRCSRQRGVGGGVGDGLERGV